MSNLKSLTLAIIGMYNQIKKKNENNSSDCRKEIQQAVLAPKTIDQALISLELLSPCY